ncbi:MAG TPA: hypothetical protein DCS67_08105, partial [Clostridiales bacterium UBA8960]|nr:hypothetical protein [Clostridiales bacterium UBA8960]
MRITQQMIVQNSLNLSKITNGDLKSLVGKVIEGQIISVKGENLATLLSGDMTLTVNVGDLNLAENQTVNLEISAFKDGVLFASLLKGSPVETPDVKWMDLFVRLGVSDTTENRAIVETLKFSDIPVTKDHFVALKQGMNEIKTLANELMKTEIPDLTKQLDVPLKSFVINLITQNAGGNQQPVALVTDSPIQNSSQMANQEATVSLPITEGQAVPVKLDLGVAEAIFSAFEGEAKVPLNNLSNTNTIETFQEAVISLLKQADYKQEALVLKNDLPLTLKNLFIAYDILGDKGTASRIMNVLSKLDQVQMPKEAMMEMIEVIA